MIIELMTGNSFMILLWFLVWCYMKMVNHKIPPPGCNVPTTITRWNMTPAEFRQKEGDWVRKRTDLLFLTGWCLDSMVAKVNIAGRQYFCLWDKQNSSSTLIIRDSWEVWVKTLPVGCFPVFPSYFCSHIPPCVGCVLGSVSINNPLDA